MSLPFLIALFTTILFGTLAIYFSAREEHLKKELKNREEVQKRRLYEIATLRAIQDRIGYSLDVERVIDTLTGSLKNLFPYATASSLLIEADKLVFKTTIEEAVSHKFIQEVKKSMVASLSTILNRPLPEHIEEIRTGRLPDDTNQRILASFFHIPIVVNGTVVGLINVSSPNPGLYKEEDMTILYQMTDIASNALSKLKEVIQTEEGKLLAMIRSLSDGLLFIDAKMQLTLINDAAKKMLVLPQKNTFLLSDILPAFFQSVDLSAAIKHVLDEKKTFEKNIALEGKTLRLLILPVIDRNDSQTIGATVVLQDITLEISLSQLKENFTNGIVHELRSPLTAIKSGVELLLSDENLTASQEKLLHIIDEQSKRMLSDINSLLDAAKMESGKLVLEKQEENIGDVLHEIVILFQPEADMRHIMLEETLSPNLPKVPIDHKRIAEVLENLISNSFKFTSAGGRIHIEASLVHHEHLPQSPTNPGLLISVSDTGSGIPKNKQSDLFSKFSQVGTSPIPHALQGTGLGLYISKGIVNAHQGQIYLQSEEGKGTTVSFTLPLTSQTTTAHQNI